MSDTAKDNRPRPRRAMQPEGFDENALESLLTSLKNPSAYTGHITFYPCRDVGFSKATGHDLSVEH